MERTVIWQPGSCMHSKGIISSVSEKSHQKKNNKHNTLGNYRLCQLPYILSYTEPCVQWRYRQCEILSHPDLRGQGRSPWLQTAS